MSNIITRSTAINQGLSTYFTGKACKHGHTAPRSTVSGACKVCHQERQREFNKKYDRKAPRSGPSTRGITGETKVTREELRARGKDWQQKNPDRTREISRTHYQNNKVLHNERATENRLLRNLGITTEQYRLIMDEHNGQCDICGTTEPGGPHKTFNLDHDHETGEIRGILCRRCNTSIGQFQDSVTLLRKAADYLNKHQTRDLYRS